MKTKPTLGQTLYSLNVGNAVSKWTPQKLTAVIVTKVGRKYFTCAEKSSGNEYTGQYFLDDWRQKTDYSCGSILYETENEWEDEKEATLICERLEAAFHYGYNRKSLPLKVLRQIDALVSGEDLASQPLELRCECGWIGYRSELVKKGSVTLADEWWECPSCSGEASKMKDIKPRAEGGADA